MAHIIGTSGAWKAVCLEVGKVGVVPAKLSEIPNLLKSARKEYETIVNKSTREIDDQIIQLKTEADQLNSSFESDIKNYRDIVTKELELAQVLLQLLEEDVTFIRRLLNYFKIRNEKQRIRFFQREYQNCPRIFQETINSLKARSEEIQKNRETLIANKCKVEKNKVQILERVGLSPDMAGAIAELEVIERLKKLPDNYQVVSDVRIRVDKAIYFDNEWLRSAQIDHVVVGPAGIFVIEVKNWSKTFTEEGNYFSPYKQVKRATYLCYTTIGQRYGLKSRSIIAHKGVLPEKPSNSYAKVLSIHEINEYILWFKEKTVTDESVRAVADWFASHQSL